MNEKFFILIAERFHTLRKHYSGNIFRITAILIVIVGVGSCRTRKPVVAGDKTAVLSSCYDIAGITVPKCDLTIADGNKSYQLTGSIYIRPDSVCYFRGVYLNMVEVMRGVIYRDSFAVINRQERICFKGKNEYLSRFTGFPVTPETLLMLFTADRCEDIYKNKLGFRITETDNNKVVMQARNGNTLEMKIDDDNRTVQSIALHSRYRNQTVFGAEYGKYRQHGQLMLPKSFEITATDGKTPVKININFRQILFDQSQKINFSIPSGYKVIVLE